MPDLQLQLNPEYNKYNITTPIIAITANSMMGVKEKCLNIGMNDVLIKPIQVLDIKKIMFQILKSFFSLSIIFTPLLETSINFSSSLLASG